MNGRQMLLVLALVLVLGGVYLATRKATVIAGTPTIKPSSKGRLVDPCPGNDVIWDADLGKCIPLVPDPVPALVQ